MAVLGQVFLEVMVNYRSVIRGLIGLVIDVNVFKAEDVLRARKRAKRQRERAYK